ncbi:MULTISPECIES: hypothetical protein [unclassified Archaeoglobus]|jgi:Arc/MetJ-type ribon-helix-helix transcriptional regulator|uniref:hypothetical protein n=1 Tax=unclassified Archaeoglobus TaxID=2643606 RepID=UPI0025C70E20|nr:MULTISPECIES: hypothetical protein [unclassified Archaeoglobus]
MKQKFVIKGDRAQLWLDGYTKRILEELMSTGDFKSISQLLQIAVINLYKDYEAKGRLKSKQKPAEEIAAEFESWSEEEKKKRLLKEIDAGEEDLI